MLTLKGPGPDVTNQRSYIMDLLHVGLGPVGQKLVYFAAELPSLRIVGAVASAEDKVGRDVGEVCGIQRLGAEVSPDLRTALARAKPDVALVATASRLVELAPQVEELARAGVHIVSTCEELSFPWTTQPKLAAHIDEVCKTNGVACLGTGVNPGFLMDYLPISLTALCRRVDRVGVIRVQDAAKRRIPFQRKIGAGLSLAQFQTEAAAGKLKHVGLPESVHMMADRLGWPLSSLTESLTPVVAEEELRSGCTIIRPGEVRGLRQVARGFLGETEVITLDFLAAVGEPRSYDRVDIAGDPNLSSNIEGGVNGDTATCAIVINAIRSIVHAKPGLRTMLDIPMIAYGRLTPTGRGA